MRGIYCVFVLHFHIFIGIDLQLIAPPLVARVADFGMSRVLSDGYYSNESAMFVLVFVLPKMTIKANFDRFSLFEVWACEMDGTGT